MYEIDLFEIKFYFYHFYLQNELDSTLEALKVREKLLESQLMVSSLNDILCENGNYLKENAKVEFFSQIFSK